MNIFTLSGEVLLSGGSKVNNELDNIDKKAGQTNKSMGSSFKSMAGAAIKLGAVLGVGLGLKEIITSAAKGQQVLAQMGAVLKSTGGAAGMSQKALVDFATAQSKVTMFSKLTVEAGENLLLTFTKIGKTTFPSVMTAAENMSTAMGTDLNSTVMTLGKALNDPLTGLTKLTKQGVTFTAQQKQQITAMAKAGDTAGAQAIMIKELNKEFGGSAVAAGKTFNGALKILQNQMVGAAATLGTTLLPYLNSFIKTIIKYMPVIQASIKTALSVVAPILANVFKKIKDIAGSFMGLSTGTKKAMLAFALMALSVMPMINAFKNAKLAISAVKMFLGGLSLPIMAVIGAIALLTLAFTKNWGGIRTKTEAFITYIKPILINTFKAVVQWFKINWPVIALWFEESMHKIKFAYQTYLAPTVKVMISALGSVVNWVRTNWPLIEKTVSVVLTRVWNIVKSILGLIKAFWHTWGQSIMDYVSTTFNIIKDVISTVMHVIGDIIVTVMNIVTGNWKGAWKGLVSICKDLFGGIVNVVKDILSGIGKQFSDFVTIAINFGKGIINGIIKGIKGQASDLAKGVGGIIKDVKDAFTKGFGIASPAKWFIWAGGHMMGGLIKGIKGANIKKFAMNLVSSIKGAFSGASLGAGLKNILVTAMGMTGTPLSELPMLEALIQHESGGNPNAINLTDSNAKAGHPSQGLMQTIPSTFARWMMPGFGGITNPLSNVLAGLRYIKGTYGSLANVPGIRGLASGKGYSGYKVGSRYVPHDVTTTVHKGEMIIPADENMYKNSGGNILPDTTTSKQPLVVQFYVASKLMAETMIEDIDKLQGNRLQLVARGGVVR